jgi:tRNA A37 methylthiotransferase MiaB
MQKVYVGVNGCDEAVLEAGRLTRFVSVAGSVLTDDVRQADLILFYACGHLQSREADSMKMIRKILALKKASARLIVWGYLTQINPACLENLYDGRLVGPESASFFCGLFSQPEDKLESTVANTLTLTSKPVRIRVQFSRRIAGWFRDSFYYRTSKIWYIKIESGCKENCTYCSDKLAYKSLESSRVEKVLEQFEEGLKRGYRYFYLVGRDLGSYGYDMGLDLTSLLNQILASFSKQDYRVFLHNISPEFLVSMYGKMRLSFDSGKIFEIGSHVQSGSDRIVRLMGKKFAVPQWVKVMKSIDENYPEVRLCTSIMVGFPTETNEDFEKSLDLFREILFDRVESYMYDERPNLPSERLDGKIRECVKKKRYDRMMYHATVNNLKKRMKRFQILY